MKAIVFKVDYFRKVDGESASILVKARSENEALKNAKFLCYTGSNFRNARPTPEKYIKPRRAGYFGSHRQ